MASKDESYRIVVVGAENSGKTALCLRLKMDDFREDMYDPTLENSYHIPLDSFISGSQLSDDMKRQKLVILDISGSEVFEERHASWFLSAHGFIFCFNSTDYSSFDSIPYWKERVFRFSKVKNAACLLVATHIDEKASRKVVAEEGKHMAYSIHCGYMEVSSKTGEGVKNAFSVIIKTIKQNGLLPASNVGSSQSTLKMNQKSNKKSSLSSTISTQSSSSILPIQSSSTFPQKSSLKTSSSSSQISSTPIQKPSSIDFEGQVIIDSQKRHLVLCGNQLFVFKTCDPTCPVSCFDLSSSSIKQLDQPNKLSLTSPLFNLNLKFSDQESALLWYSAISVAISNSIAQTISDKSLLQAQSKTKSDRFSISGHMALQALHSIKENRTCADCGALQPDWASINLGVVICIQCAGIHRSFGTHISKVRSIVLDEWDPYLIDMTLAISNKRAASIWEAHVVNAVGTTSQIRPTSDMSRQDKEEYIRNKYVRRCYLDPIFKTSLAPYVSAVQAANMQAKNQNLSNVILPSPEDVLPASVVDSIKTACISAAKFIDLVAFVSHGLRTDSFIGKHSLLHLACINGNYLAALYLLENGANPNIVDFEGKRPMDYSTEFDAKAVAIARTQAQLHAAPNNPRANANASKVLFSAPAHMQPERHLPKASTILTLFGGKLAQPDDYPQSISPAKHMPSTQYKNPNNYSYLDSSGSISSSIDYNKLVSSSIDPSNLISSSSDSTKPTTPKSASIKPTTPTFDSTKPTTPTLASIRPSSSLLQDDESEISSPEKVARKIIFSSKLEDSNTAPPPHQSVRTPPSTPSSVHVIQSSALARSEYHFMPQIPLPPLSPMALRSANPNMPRFSQSQNMSALDMTDEPKAPGVIQPMIYTESIEESNQTPISSDSLDDEASLHHFDDQILDHISTEPMTMYIGSFESSMPIYFEVLDDESDFEDESCVWDGTIPLDSIHTHNQQSDLKYKSELIYKEQVVTEEPEDEVVWNGKIE